MLDNFFNFKENGTDFKTEIIGESNDGNGTLEITYNVKYWDRTEERKTYVTTEKKQG